ncbi:MAG TPA: cupin domain-containing protein [Gemmatimonadales bacterium]|nr:cupin domain-containing protein [Gemmatimonadales bacterium]
MSSIERPLSGDVVIVELSGGGEGPLPGGRRARTLIKNGLIRATLVTVAAGAEIPEHQADGPITVQPLQGRLQFSAAGNTHDIGPGQLLSLGAGVRHAVASASGATFLLTVASVGASGDPPRAS